MNEIKETEEVKDLISKLKSEELSYGKVPHEKRILIFKYCKTRSAPGKPGPRPDGSGSVGAQSGLDPAQAGSDFNNLDDPFHLNLLGLLYSNPRIGNNSELSYLYYSKAIEMGDEFAKYNLHFSPTNTQENINVLRKLNIKSSFVKLDLGCYLIEVKKYSEAIEVLSEIVNEKFHDYGRVMWNLHICYKELEDTNLSLLYFKKSLLVDLKKSAALNFPELQIVNKDSNKCAVKITHYLVNIFNVNLIELIVDYFE